ncbi:hypothetical protein NE237_014433 [Protea cynaroides]|uniref:Uncharacterized protein n=1 Tax=Protea cynaroides TaxID=273540 RepID=A0A9Q0KC40_9MAGN|nr:hypothetical protein NE237_014433 [Protea cynaroides]
MILGGISPNHLTWNLHVKTHNRVVQGIEIDIFNCSAILSQFLLLAGGNASLKSLFSYELYLVVLSSMGSVMSDYGFDQQSTRFRSYSLISLVSDTILRVLQVLSCLLPWPDVFQQLIQVFRRRL